jgi:hypothetical protein
MTKIKLLPKSSAETEPYGAWKNVNYDNAIVEAELFEHKGLQGAYILGEELLRIGVKGDSVKPNYKFIYADFEIVEE